MRCGRRQEPSGAAGQAAHSSSPGELAEAAQAPLQTHLEVSASHLEAIVPLPRTETVHMPQKKWRIQQESGAGRTRQDATLLYELAPQPRVKPPAWLQRGSLTFLEAWHQLVNDVLHGSVMTAERAKRGVRGCYLCGSHTVHVVSTGFGGIFLSVCM